MSAFPFQRAPAQIQNLGKVRQLENKVTISGEKKG
jgi:hypothetical protein